MLLCDTGVLLAAGNVKETRPHQALPSVITQRGKKTIGSEHNDRTSDAGGVRATMHPAIRLPNWPV